MTAGDYALLAEAKDAEQRARPDLTSTLLGLDRAERDAALQDAVPLCRRAAPHVVREDGEKRKAIDLWLRIFSVHAIDTGAQTFTVDFVLAIDWHDPKLTEKLEEEPDGATTRILTPEEEEKMTPGIRFDNLTGDLSRKLSFLRRKGDGLVTWELFAVGTFLDPVDAHLFPYDVQDFNMRFRLNQLDCLGDAANFGMFICCQAPSRIALDCQHVPEWTLHGITSETGANRITWADDMQSYYDWMSVDITVDKDRVPTKGWWAQVECGFFASRKASYYEINILSMTFVIGALGLASFAIGRGDHGDRLGFNAALLLAEVALRYSFADSLPKLSYMSHADYMIYGVFACLTLLIMLQTATGVFDPDEALVSDTVCSACYAAMLALLWAVLHCRGKCRFKSFMSRRHLKDDEAERKFAVVKQDYKEGLRQRRKGTRY